MSFIAFLKYSSISFLVSRVSGIFAITSLMRIAIVDDISRVLICVGLFAFALRVASLPLPLLCEFASGSLCLCLFYFSIFSINFWHILRILEHIYRISHIIIKTKTKNIKIYTQIYRYIYILSSFTHPSPSQRVLPCESSIVRQP